MCLCTQHQPCPAPSALLWWLACSGQDCTADQLESIKAVVAGAMLCNDSHLNHTVGTDGKETWAPNGAPTEVSLITVGVKAGLTVEAVKAAQPRIASVPFESEHK